MPVRNRHMAAIRIDDVKAEVCAGAPFWFGPGQYRAIKGIEVINKNNTSPQNPSNC